MDITFIALSVIVLLFSVILHEVMHGFVALKFGDRTALNAGRLTLNPLPHIDPIGTILVPAMLFILPLLTGVQPGFLIGWAKPVPVNPLNFDNIRRGELMVSIAGIAANFFLAFSAAILYHLFGSLNPLLAHVLQFTVGLNLALGIFNLLPIPPLDGSKTLMALLPYKSAHHFDRFSNFGPIILLALLYFGVLGIILKLILLPIHRLLQIPPL